LSTVRHLRSILDELAANQQWVDEAQLERLARELLRSNRVFLLGAGRSGAAIRGFASRLMHLGIPAALVGDITSPHSAAGDLLVIGSGSGETDSLVGVARKAARASVRIALITMNENSTLGRLADVVVVLPGVSPKLSGTSRPVASIQPMGSAFEQMSWLVYDALVLELMERTHQSSETMFLRHADLE
jgi:6-phospho-3-hexuloisomerase